MKDYCRFGQFKNPITIRIYFFKYKIVDGVFGNIAMLSQGPYFMSIAIVISCSISTIIVKRLKENVLYSCSLFNFSFKVACLYTSNPS